MHQRLWEISVLTSPEAEEAVGELLQQLTDTPSTSYHDRRTDRVKVAVHVAHELQLHRQLRQRIQDGLAHIRACDLNPDPAQVRIHRLAPVDWAESWKEHFPPLEIGKALLIKPHWIQRVAKTGQSVVELDPGLSFGTGHHPTTQFCLEELVRTRPSTNARSLLDIGTGSGLLAIAAVKLGFRPVRAFDYDPVAVKIARRNARANGVGRRIRIYQADLRHLAEPPTASDVVCANLQSDLLTHRAQLIVATLRPGGTLVLAGILKSEMPQIRSTFLKLGLRCHRLRSRAEWSSASFLHPG